MATNEYRFIRELNGPPLGRSLEIFKSTCLWHSLEPAPADTFAAAAHHKAGVTALDIDRQQGRYLVSGGADGSVCMWDLDGTDHQRGLEPTASVPRSRTRSHRFGVSSVSFYPSDAGLFVTGSYDKTVKVWDAAEMAPAFTFKLDTGVHSTGMAARALHSLVAVASEAATVRLLDLKTGTGTHSLVGHIGEVLAVGWSPRDEFLLASGGCDGTARLWDIRMAASCLASLDMDDTSRPGLDGRNCAHQGFVNGLAWCEDGRSLVTFGEDEKLRVWDLATGRNTLTNFDPAAGISNRRRLTLNPVLTCVRHSDPQIVFIPSMSEIMGFHTAGGDVTLKQRVTEHKINVLTNRPHTTELYYGTTGGEINILRPPTAEDENEVDDDESKERREAKVLETIYRSLVQTPITFNA